MAAKRPAALELKISAIESSLKAGETYQIDYTYTGNSAGLIWVSSDKTVATVNRQCLVSAKKAGTVEISVKDTHSNGSASKYRITLLEPDEPPRCLRIN